MLDPSLDKALDLAFSLASNSFAAALRGVQLLSSILGVKPEVIVAGIAGLIAFILLFKIFALANRRDLSRQTADLRRRPLEIPKDWHSQAHPPNKVPESPDEYELVQLWKQLSRALSRAGTADPAYGAAQRSFEPSPTADITDPAHSFFQNAKHIPPQESSFQLSDELREQLQEKFSEKSSELSVKAADIADSAYNPAQSSFEPSRTAELELTVQLRDLPQKRIVAERCEPSRIMTSEYVSTKTHKNALDELDKSQKLSVSQAAELNALRQKSKGEADRLQQQLTWLQQNLDRETSQRKNSEQQAAILVKEREALIARSAVLQSRLDGLEREKGQLGNELTDVRVQIASLEKKLSDERAQVTALENDKQQLASGTATAQSEIAKLQQRAVELEAEAARVAKEREQLRREQSRLSATLDQERERLRAAAEEKARLAMEREQLRQEQSQLSARLDEEQKRLRAKGGAKARLEGERPAKADEIRRLTRTQEDPSQSLKDKNAKGNTVADSAHSCLHPYATRVGRNGLRDFVYRLGGWYPWECGQCFRSFYRHQRY